MYIVWGMNDYGEFACWRQLHKVATLQEVKIIEKDILDKNCDYSTKILLEGQFPSGYEAQRQILNRGW